MRISCPPRVHAGCGHHADRQRPCQGALSLQLKMSLTDAVEVEVKVPIMSCCCSVPPSSVSARAYRVCLSTCRMQTARDLAKVRVRFEEVIVEIEVEVRVAVDFCFSVLSQRCMLVSLSCQLQFELTTIAQVPVLQCCSLCRCVQQQRVHVLLADYGLDAGVMQIM